MPATDADALEASYTETVEAPPVPAVAPPEPDPPVEPIPCPGATPLTRSDVQRCARTIAAQVTGLAGLIEQAALFPDKVRPEFLRAWRTWCGAYLADAARLERDLFKAQDEAARLAGYAKRLAQWRAGIAAELGQDGAAQVGKSEPAPAEPKPATWAAPRHWPVWIWAPAGFGAVVGAYMSVRWVFRQCLDSITSSGDREQAGERE